MPPIESELKFTCDTAALPDLMRIDRLGDFLRTEDQESQHVDLYFDTSDLRLFGHDVGLRVRQLNDGRLRATFKGASSPRPGSNAVHRSETETDLHPNEFEMPKGQVPVGSFLTIPAFSAAHDLLGEVMIQPVASIITSRSSAALSRPAGGRVELSFDRVAGTRAQDGRQIAFCEVELEIVEGDVEVLGELGEELQRRVPGLETSTDSKLARTLQDE